MFTAWYALNPYRKEIRLVTPYTKSVKNLNTTKFHFCFVEHVSA